MGAVTLRAFAKINLALRVKEARPDGYHEVQTILQAIDLFDRVTIAGRRGPFTIRCDTRGIPLDRTNLVWQAALRLWQAAGLAGEPRNVAIMLQKRIPMKAGLGGGSSDAAAALLGLRRVWKLPVSDEDLNAIAAALGSDVPYFFVGGTALALGRGEDVYPLEDLPRLWVVLVFPPFGVSTRDAYGWLDAERLREPVSPEAFESRSRRLFGGRPLVNDLEAPVIDRHPLIAVLKQRLATGGAIMAAMSGSGSTVFGVFESEKAANASAGSLKKDGARVLLARFLPRRRA
jgi:4-diphosphocytidyl-2-C-methyl-D-erythritol kinase